MNSKGPAQAYLKINNGKKLISDKEVLAEYKLKPNYIKVFILFTGSALMFAVLKNEGFKKDIIIWTLLAGIVFVLMIELARTVKLIYHNKVYLTKSYFITEKGSKYGLNHIYYVRRSFFDYFAGILTWSEILFYNKKEFVFYIKEDMKDKNYRKFIKALVEVTGNEDLINDIKGVFPKRKLIQAQYKKNR